MAKQSDYLDVTELTFTELETGESRTHKCTHYQRVLIATCPVDGTNLLEGIGEEYTAVSCPACGIVYDTVDNASSRDLRYGADFLASRVRAEYSHLQDDLGKLIAKAQGIERRIEKRQARMELLRPHVQTSPQPNLNEICREMQEDAAGESG